jgi:trimeric autotransporter adhesin
MTATRVRLFVYLLLICCALPLMAQPSPGAVSIVPAMVKFTGTLNDVEGKALAGTVGVTFLLYQDQVGGAPLWLETQNVQADKNGRYSVMLGAASSQGIPSEAFAAGQARWLAVQPSGQNEQARVVLVSVPYALKALDAETIGGLPASAFVRTNDAPSKGTSTPAAKAPIAEANPAVTGKGVANFVPLWNTASDIVDSLIFQKSSSLGISTKTPAATLDVNGKGDVRDTLTLFPKGSDPTLAVNGTTFKVDSTGKVTFVSGQTFPGKGSVTSVALAAPTSDFTVTGSPITTSGTLGLNWIVTPTSAATGNAIVKRDANGAFAAGEIVAATADTYGVEATGGSHGVYGTTTNSAGNGVWGYNPNHTGVYGDGGVGVWGHSGTGYGVYGASFGSSASSDGVHGETTSGGASGVAGVNDSGGVGVYGVGGSYGIFGISGSASGNGVGAYNTSTGDALFAENQSGGDAAFFLGDVDVDGNLSKAGGSFKIDDPLDPANKYLFHSFVESPDMMNIYNGNVTTDSSGNAVVTMPDWFEALNQDFRYQLTVMGQFAQAIVASEISNHSFTIQTDKPNVKVSWQVTGVRHDVWANAHRIPVEQLKPDGDRGLYLHPELFGAPRDKSIAAAHHPEPKIPLGNGQERNPIQ